jgi:hypothetical protein
VTVQRDFFGRGRGSSSGAFQILEDAGIHLATEEITDGEQREERELCFVGRISHADILEKAIRIEHHEERVLFLTPKEAEVMARLRIRRCTINGETTDTLTFKVRGTEEQFNKESSVPCPQGLFDLFSIIPDVRCNEKTRYVFALGEPYSTYGEEWEVDVFELADGTTSTWCKIDYEIKHDPSEKTHSAAVPGRHHGHHERQDRKGRRPRFRR